MEQRAYVEKLDLHTLVYVFPVTLENTVKQVRLLSK